MSGGVTVVDEIRARARERPRHPALVLGAAGAPADTADTRVSYAELVAAFDAVAGKLRAEGVRAGDRVGLVARQGRGFVEAALGVLAAGACVAPIPDDTSEPALVRFRERAHLHHLLRESGAGGLSHERFADVEPVDGQGDRAFRALRPAYLRFTSGTTHERKGVVIGHAAVLARLAAANRALGIGPDDRILWLLPMAHHFVVSILLYLRYGATVLLPASSLARPVLELCARHPASVLYASPYHYRLLAKDTSGLRLDGVRLAISTATGLHPQTAALFRERFGIPLGQALGIIEVGLPAIDLAGAKPGSLGQPLPDYEIRLLAEDGSPAPGDAPERSGEIAIRGPGLFDAYLEPWTPAREFVEPHGFRTGDQGWLDADGDLHLAGRRSNRLSMAGMKFFAEEVEAVLDGHSGVRASRVFARPHPQLGDVPVAEVVAEDPAAPPEPRELVAFCRERLEAYKVPRRIEVVASLPTTETGKVRRWDRRDRAG